MHKGMPVAWLHRSVAPTIVSTFDAKAKQEANWELGMGVINVPFAIPNIRIENPEAIAHTRIGWFRSVSNIPHAFAVQSFVAELAAAAGRDPKDYLLEVIGPARVVSPQMLGDTWNHGESPERYPVDTGRLRRVAELAAKEAGWGRTLPKGSGLGIAAHYSFVSYVAAVVEVAVDAKGELTIPRVDIAVDCGATVNPDRVRAQMEGACVMGVSAATLGEISFKDGRAQQDNFDTVRGDAHVGGAARDPRAHRARRLQQAAGRRGRTRRAAGAAGAVQCDLRGDGQAHPAVADSRSAARLDSARLWRSVPFDCAMASGAGGPSVATRLPADRRAVRTESASSLHRKTAFLQTGRQKAILSCRPQFPKASVIGLTVA